MRGGDDGRFRVFLAAEYREVPAVIVVLGYMVGLAGKIVSWQRTGVLAYSVWFYILNMVMVSIDIVLYFRNSALDRAREQA